MAGRPPTPDPLEDFSGLSLFPRTLASLPNPPRPSDPDDLQHAHDFLKSMPLRSPDKLIEQAKEIVDNSLELGNLDMTSSAAELVENPRERRPGLGRKRARFSLKPNSSQPTVSLESSLDIDIDKLKDPEEFFRAFERAEYAKREIQKQTGAVLMDLDQNNQSLAARPRRPGLLQRSVKYKHLYSTATTPLENFEEEIASPLCDSQQENPEGIASPCHDSQQENPEGIASPRRDSQQENPEGMASSLGDSQQYVPDLNVELQEKELAGLATNAENKVNELLNELLAGDYDGDETFSLLQERLQIKPLDLPKICLPDLQDIRTIDLKASRENLAKPRNSLLDIQNFMKGIGKGTLKRQAENSVHHLSSPTPPKSTLASISLLKKRMLPSDVPSDPFSTDDIDQSPAINASPIEKTGRQSNQVDVERELSVSHNNNNRRTQKQDENSGHPLASPTPPRNPMASMSLQKKQMLQSDSLCDPFSDDNIEQSPGGNMSTENANKQYGQVTEKEPNMSHLFRCPILEANETALINSSELDGRDFASHFDKFVNDNSMRFDYGIDIVTTAQADLDNSNLNRPEIDADSRIIRPNEFDGRVEDIPVEAVFSSQNRLNKEGPTNDDPPTIQRESDESNSAMVVDHTMDRSLRTAEGGQEVHEQKNKNKRKSRPHKERKQKTVTRRQSLADSGTTFDAEGRRRSTRIRSRPLEFWKGERFLYGRIHSSMTTVIGIKYESPGKADGEKTTLKVKSFVGDEYKDLVELASRF